MMLQAAAPYMVSDAKWRSAHVVLWLPMCKVELFFFSVYVCTPLQTSATHTTHTKKVSRMYLHGPWSGSPPTHYTKHRARDTWHPSKPMGWGLVVLKAVFDHPPHEAMGDSAFPRGMTWYPIA